MFLKNLLFSVIVLLLFTGCTSPQSEPNSQIEGQPEEANVEDAPLPSINESVANLLKEELEKKFDLMTYTLEITPIPTGFAYKFELSGGPSGDSNISMVFLGELDKEGWHLSRKSIYFYCAIPSGPDFYCEQSEVDVTYDSKTHKDKSIKGFYSQLNPHTQEARKRFEIKDLKSYKRAKKESRGPYLNPPFLNNLKKPYLTRLRLDLRDDFR